MSNTKAAREQAKNYNSIFAPKQLVFDDGSSVELPPHPNLRMLDDDRQEAYEELLFEAETTYDRGPDIHIPEQRLKDPNTGNETGVVLPAETQPGPLLQPYRKDGQLIKPPHSVRVVIAAIGQEAYDLIRSKQINGRKASAADVWRVWNEQGMELTERVDADPKSDAGLNGLAAVAATNGK